MNLLILKGKSSRRLAKTLMESKACVENVSNKIINKYKRLDPLRTKKIIHKNERRWVENLDIPEIFCMTSKYFENFSST